MAAASIEGNDAAPAVRKHITESVARLNDAGDTGRTSAADAQTVQDLRTYKIARPAGVSGGGTFRLQIGTIGVIASQQMSGEQKLARISQRLTR